ncbi:hypothetical protein [Variovorax boronicumulans]|uniref:hypothetical protein n=1 Tax=Variovorax boronicumulans TaxID=436515 RepID=UPI001C575F55
MKRLSGFNWSLCGAGALLAACSQMPMPPPPEVDVVQASRSTQLTPPPKLVPQPEGTPLPPRDLRIAERWPPEIKQLIDSMLSLFPKGERPPNVREVEKKMGIVLTERLLKQEEMGYLSKRYVVSGTRYMALVSGFPEGSDLEQRYYIDNGRNTGGERRQVLTLVTSPPQSGFCLDPYELAVYTGATFINGDTTVHSDIRIWAPAYVWGLFDWSRTGRYIGQGFSIVIGVNPPDQKREPDSTNCVQTITVQGRYLAKE